MPRGKIKYKTRTRRSWFYSIFAMMERRSLTKSKKQFEVSVPLRVPCSQSVCFRKKIPWAVKFAYVLRMQKHYAFPWQNSLVIHYMYWFCEPIIIHIHRFSVQSSQWYAVLLPMKMKIAKEETQNAHKQT